MPKIESTENMLYTLLGRKMTDDELVDIYSDMRVPSEDIDSLVVLDVRDDEFFRSHGYADPHAGGNAFAFDEAVMDWLFGPHPDV